MILGPATVGGIQAGAFKIGDTAGTIDNIIACKLYRPGSVGFVSKSVILYSNQMQKQFYSLKFSVFNWHVDLLLYDYVNIHRKLLARKKNII